MKLFLQILSIISFIFLLSCNKEELNQPLVEKKIEFSTDKNVYYDMENIAIKFQNNTSSYIGVNWCRLYYLEKYQADKWESMGGPPCPGESGFEIAPHTVKSDTLHSNWLDKGKYRLATFTLRLDTTYFKVYSNEFDITDFGNYIN